MVAQRVAQCKLGHSDYTTDRKAPLISSAIADGRELVLHGQHWLSIDASRGSGYVGDVGAPRVFISYSHESDDHKARVLELARKLRCDGFDAWIDRFAPPPIKGWPHWMGRQVRDAQWVLLVFTETYRRRFEQCEEPGQGRGATWEGRLVVDEMYSGAEGADRFIPVTFSPGDTKHIPSPLSTVPHYCLDQDEAYAALRRHMRREPEVTPQPVGESAGSPPSPPSVEPAHVQSPGARDDLPLETGTAVETSSEETKTILIVAANRARDGRLALGREVREIAAALRGATSLKFDVHIVWAADDEEFRASFLEHDPHILHFCGHGGTNGPVLEQMEPGTEEVAGKALQRWLKVALAGTRLEIAVLNFCDTQEMLDELASTAPIVIGPIRSIIDEHAITFSSVFYAALASGGSGSFAYHLGRSAVEMTPADAGTTRDIPAPPPAPRPEQYGIRCASDGERPVFAGPRRSADVRTFTFFASEPEALPRQHLDHQLRRIVRRPPSPERFRIEQRWATRPLDFVHTLMTTRPAIVHVTGYGAPDGAFRFEHDRYPQGVAARHHTFARVLAAFHQHIECAVLMFNHSCHAAQELEDILDYVIAVDGVVSNSATLRFSELFYQLIWYQRSYQRAFDGALGGLADEQAAFTLRGCCVHRKIHPFARVLSSPRDVVMVAHPGPIPD